MKNIFRILSIAVIAVMIFGLLILAIPTGSASAQAPQPPKGTPQPKVEQARVKIGVERAFKMEERRLKEQGQLLKRTDMEIKRVEKLIERASAKGTNTKVLQDALNAFTLKKAEAQTAHDAAAAIIQDHKGFDNNGKVTDLAQARETVKSAHEKLVAARKTIGPAFKDFMKALHEWLQANKPGGNK